MLKQLAFFFRKFIHSATATSHCIIMHIPPKEGNKEKVKILVLLSNFQHGVTAAYDAHELVDCAQNFLAKRDTANKKHHNPSLSAIHSCIVW